MVSRLFSCVLLSAWFAWCLVFTSGMGCWHTGQHNQWVCHSGPQGRPLKALLSTPLTLFAWLCVRVRPSVVHVGWYTIKG